MNRLTKIIILLASVYLVVLALRYVSPHILAFTQPVSFLFTPMESLLYPLFQQHTDASVLTIGGGTAASLIGKWFYDKLKQSSQQHTDQLSATASSLASGFSQSLGDTASSIKTWVTEKVDAVSSSSNDRFHALETSVANQGTVIQNLEAQIASKLTTIKDQAQQLQSSTLENTELQKQLTSFQDTVDAKIKEVVAPYQTEVASLKKTNEDLVVSYDQKLRQWADSYNELVTKYKRLAELYTGA